MHVVESDTGGIRGQWMMINSFLVAFVELEKKINQPKQIFQGSSAILMEAQV